MFLCKEILTSYSFSIKNEGLFFNIKKKAKHKMNVNLIALVIMVEFRSLNKPWYIYCKTGSKHY